MTISVAVSGAQNRIGDDPKRAACLKAIDQGVERALSWTYLPYCMLLETFMTTGIGTQVVTDEEIG